MAYTIGANNKEYISSLNFAGVAGGLDKRDYLKEVFDVTNESSTIVDVLEMTGRVKNTDAVNYSHAENAYLFKAAAISSVDATNTGAGTGTAASALLKITITSATNDACPVVGEIAMFQNKNVGLVVAVDTSAATPVVTVKPLDSTTAIATTAPAVAAAQSVIFFSAGFAEGTGDPSVRQSEWASSTNNIQIFKEAGEITDLQKVAAIEVQYNGKPYVMYKMQYDTFQRHKMKMANALLFGRKSAVLDSTSFTTGNKVYTTQGLRNYILNGDGSVKTTGGVSQTYSKSTGVSVTGATGTIRLVSRALDKNQAPDEYMGYIGGDLYAQLDEALAALEGVKYGINYSAFGTGDAKKRAIDLGFDSFRFYGRTWHLNKLKLLDHKGLFGAGSGGNAYDFSYEGYFVPQDKIKIDAGGGTSDRMLLRVMSGDGTNFYPHMETVTGKLAPTPTNVNSVLHISYQTIAGLQVCGTDHFAILRGT